MQDVIISTKPSVLNNVSSLLMAQVQVGSIDNCRKVIHSVPPQPGGSPMISDMAEIFRKVINSTAFNTY